MMNEISETGQLLIKKFEFIFDGYMPHENIGCRIDSPGLRFAGPPSLRLRRKEGRENKK